jgi:hypothetical protein
MGYLRSDSNVNFLWVVRIRTRHIQYKTHATLATISGLTVTHMRETHILMQILQGRSQRNQAQTVGDDFILQSAAVFLEFDEIDGEGGHLGDHDAAQRVGGADVGVEQLEVGEIIAQLEQTDFWVAIHFLFVEVRVLSIH